MELGVFVPSGNNGWLISEASPQYEATFELASTMARIAEDGGLDFLLTPVKYRGFGGITKHWDRNLEPLTLMSAVAARTSRIKLYGSVAALTMHPAVAARMATTIDSVAPGRFGINMVSGWQPGEYAQMGLWPGDEYFKQRYDYVSEYAAVLRELWEKGQSDFKGQFFQLDDCRMGPRPLHGHIDIVCAGESDRGLRFCAEYGDYQFVSPRGVNAPTAHAGMNERLAREASISGRSVGAYPLFMVIADATEEAARDKWRRYNEGADTEALSFMIDQGSANTEIGADSSIARLVLPEGAVNLNQGTLVGSYEQMAHMLDEAAAVPGTAGIMMAFDHPVDGLESFIQRVEPLMQCRTARQVLAQ